MSSIFSRIIRNEIPSYKIVETDTVIAFLDVNPLAKGHTLIVPKLEVDKIYDLPLNNLNELTTVAGSVSKAIEKAISCARVGWAVVGFEVPHAHIHLIPIDNIEDIDFSRTRVKLNADEMTEIAIHIQKYL